MASALGAQPANVVFTSGGAEANRLAVLGSMAAHLGSEAGPRTPRWASTSLEHPTVIGPLRALERCGKISLRQCPPQSNGAIDVDRFVAEANAADFVSVCMVQGETGVIQPLERLIAALRQVGENRGPVVHTDAVAAVGRTVIDFEKLDVSLLSISGHKLGAVGGIGALLVRDGANQPAGPTATLLPTTFGGAQEGGRRAGTENIAGAASLAAALAQPVPMEQTSTLRDAFERQLLQGVDGMETVGGSTRRTCNVSCLRFAGVPGEFLVQALDSESIWIGCGPACNTGVIGSSPALLSMGLNEQDAAEAIRVSIGPATTSADLDCAARALIIYVKRYRSMTGD